MNTLKEIIERRVALNAENEARQRSITEWNADLKAQLQKLTEAEALIAGGVDLDRLRRGLTVVYVRGSLKYGGESYSCVVDAKADIAKGAPKLMRETFGAKNYDRWTGQRSDHTYGMGPRHGSIVFEIGLTRPVHDAQQPLTDDQINDALYVLANIDKLDEARKSAA